MLVYKIFIVNVYLWSCQQPGNSYLFKAHELTSPGGVREGMVYWATELGIKTNATNRTRATCEKNYL